MYFVEIMINSSEHIGSNACNLYVNNFHIYHMQCVKFAFITFNVLRYSHSSVKHVIPTELNSMALCKALVYNNSPIFFSICWKLILNY